MSGKSRNLNAGPIDFCFEARDRRRPDEVIHPLAGTPLCRGDVLQAIEQALSSQDLGRRAVDVPVGTREGRLTLGLCPSQRLVKRVLDLMLAIVLILLLSPVFLAVAVLTKMSSRGPILFRQVRIGLGGEEFNVYKFRTMVVDAERRLRENPALYQMYRENGFKLPADIDPRTSLVGKHLRATSLDELPQLLNVVLGDMSLVGARPVLEEELVCYERLGAVYTSSRPGVTGAWQVAGRSTIGFPTRAQLDTENVRNWSPFKDLRVLFRTIPSVLSRRGAF